MDYLEYDVRFKDTCQNALYHITRTGPCERFLCKTVDESPV